MLLQRGSQGRRHHYGELQMFCSFRQLPRRTCVVRALKPTRQLKLNLSGSREVNHPSMFKQHGFVIFRHVRLHQWTVPVPLNIRIFALELPPTDFIRFWYFRISRVLSPIAEAFEMSEEADSLVVVD